MTEAKQTSRPVVGRLEASVRRSAWRNPPNLGKRIGDTDDLPDSVKCQLSKAVKKDLQTLESRIIDAVQGLEGICTTDELMVALWRQYGVVTENRRELANRLYRMTRKGWLVSVKGRRGLWALP